MFNAYRRARAEREELRKSAVDSTVRRYRRQGLDAGEIDRKLSERAGQIGARLNDLRQQGLLDEDRHKEWMTVLNTEKSEGALLRIQQQDPQFYNEHLSDFEYD
jgi:hypothetical protein